MRNIILQFNFETDDASCKYYQVYVIVKSEDSVNYGELEDSICSYFESDLSDDDKEYENNVEDIMRESGLTWEFVGSSFPSSDRIYSFWI